MRSIFLLLVSLVAFSGVSYAEESKPAEELKNVEKQLSTQKAEVAEIEKKEQETQKDLKNLQRKLIDATAALQIKEEEQQELEDQAERLEKEVAARGAVLAEAEERLKLLAEAFLKISRQPPESFLFRDAGTTDHIHRSLLLRSLLPKLQQESEHLGRELSEIEALKAKTAAQKMLVDAARQNLESQRGGLDEMIRMRQGLLEKTTAEKEAVARQLAALSSEAQTLRQLLDKVSRPTRAPSPEAEPALKAHLKPPVAGRILRAYGEKDSYGVASEGVTYLGSAGSPVIAPQEGKVVFVGPFKGYGQIVILQHKGGFHSFLAGFGRIDANMGQTVTGGEPLGVLPPKGGEKPELYFEWRRQGEPANPLIGKKG